LCAPPSVRALIFLALARRCARDLVAALKENIQATKKQCHDLEADEKGLDAKIKRKQADLERHEKRLKSLSSVRPAFMDEYEKLEKDLVRHYEGYLERFRNLDFLEHELDAYHKDEQEKVEENDRNLKRMQKKLREEELRQLRGEMVRVRVRRGFEACQALRPLTGRGLYCVVHRCAITVPSLCHCAPHMVAPPYLCPYLPCAPHLTRATIASPSLRRLAGQWRRASRGAHRNPATLQQAHRLPLHDVCHGVLRPFLVPLLCLVCARWLPGGARGAAARRKGRRGRRRT